MVINPLREQVMPLQQLGKQLPGRPRYNTLLEWCKLGRRNRNTSKRVKLEVIRMPGGMASSLEAYLRFIERLNSLDS